MSGGPIGFGVAAASSTYLALCDKDWELPVRVIFFLLAVVLLTITLVEVFS